MAGRDSLFFRSMTLLLKVRSPFDMAIRQKISVKVGSVTEMGCYGEMTVLLLMKYFKPAVPRGSSFTKRFLDKGAPPHHIGRQSGATYKDSGSASPSSLAVSRP